MTMKRPAFFPDINPDTILPSGRKCSLPEAMEAYGNALLEYNEACLEASESALEIVRALRKMHANLNIKASGADTFTISKGELSVSLRGDAEEQVRLYFSPRLKGIDLSDFGPKDAAGFICAVFSSYDRVASAVINHHN